MKALQMRQIRLLPVCLAICTGMTRAGKPHNDRVEEKRQS